MSDQSHLEILETGLEAWNQWRIENPSVRPDLVEGELSSLLKTLATSPESWLNLRNADLRGADLTETYAPFINFDEADLRGAYMAESEFHHTTFVGADLREATLNGSDFFRADFSKANLGGAWLTGSDLRETVFREAILVGADLTHAVLTDVVLEGSDLIACRVYGVSAWNIDGAPKNQRGLIITRESEPSIEVDDLRVAQFVHLLLEHKNLRDIFTTMADRGVLILGRFGGGGLEVLRAIAEVLREMKYLPMIFDFACPRNRNYTETVQTLAGLSRFVIVDLSGPSVPQELYATVPHFKIPFVPILERGQRAHATCSDILEYDWVIEPVLEFTDVEMLIELIPEKVVKPAEKERKVREKKREKSRQQLS